MRRRCSPSPADQKKEDNKVIDRFITNHCRVYRCQVCGKVMAELNCNPGHKATCRRAKCKRAWREYLFNLNDKPTTVMAPSRV